MHGAFAGTGTTTEAFDKAIEAAKEETLPLWEADWNDEEVGEDFTTKLKAEQQRQSGAA